MNAQAIKIKITQILRALHTEEGEEIFAFFKSLPLAIYWMKKMILLNIPYSRIHCKIFLNGLINLL